MTIARSLQDYLHDHGVAFDVIQHDYAPSSARTAAAAHLPGDRLAKSVLLEDDRGYLVAVVPSTHRVDIGRLGRALDRRLGLATEDEVEEVFKDCVTGAIPPLGAVYGIETVLDDSLAAQPEIYFEAGDHEELIRVSAQQFARLMTGSRRARFSHHT